ncbi:MAG: Fe-S cluster assembly ATPase SufC [Hyphomicrobiaceae bacterium]|nr:Fe-S cluster assembly ATPase SufC [Hyphomicrobiaceae bacterium]
MLEIRDLHVRIEDEGTEILKGVNLTVPRGEVHAIMGRNGSGKSTLSYAISGREGYEITEGDVLLDGKSILDMEVDERAAAGLFLAFQYPIEIPGVATMTFLKAAMNAQRKARGEDELGTPEFMKEVRNAAAGLSIDNEMLKRALNVGFSGGEKKRAEILQMALLKPKMCILDETDSGLDIDALKVVSDGVNALRGPDRSMLVITHYQRLLNHIVPDRVHVFADGRVVESGDKDLALELESKGYAAFDGKAA